MWNRKPSLVTDINPLSYTSEEMTQIIQDCIFEFRQTDSRTRQDELVTLMKCYREGNEIPHPIDFFHVLTNKVKVSFNLYNKQDGHYGFLALKDMIKVNQNSWRAFIHVNTSPVPFIGKDRLVIKQTIRRILIHELVHALQILNGDPYESNQPYHERYCEREAENVAVFYCEQLHPLQPLIVKKESCSE